MFGKDLSGALLELQTLELAAASEKTYIFRARDA
jgi:hypothetical protein